MGLAIFAVGTAAEGVGMAIAVLAGVSFSFTTNVYSPQAEMHISPPAAAAKAGQRFVVADPVARQREDVPSI